MAREDIPPLPKTIPRKRRQIERLLDVHIAMWLAQHDLPPGDRKRLEEEKADRRRKNPEVRISFWGSRTGMTPQQKEAVQGYILEFRPKSVHYLASTGGTSAYNFHRICKKLHHQREYDIQLDLVTYRDIPGAMQEIIKQGTVVIMTARANSYDGLEPDFVEAYRYARDRKLPIRFIWPDGNLLIPKEDE